MAYAALSVANALIDFAHEDGGDLTNMKLQKLLYFSEGHHLAHRNSPLLDEVPLAWRYGPVYRSVYDAFKHYGSGPITEHAFDSFTDEVGDDSFPDLAPSKKQFVRAIWDTYKTKTAAQLSAMSHVSNGPWSEARKWGDEPISRSSMFDYFSSLRQRASRMATAAQ